MRLAAELRLLIQHFEPHCHANEIRKRSGVHLAHQIASMNLHRHDRDGQHSRNLLVKKSPYNEREYLVLAPGKARMTTLERGYARTPFANAAIAIECFPYSGDQRACLYGMNQKINRPAFDGANPARHIRVDTDEYGRWTVLLCQTTLQIKSRHVRQVKIGDDAGGGILPYTVQEFPATSKTSDADTGCVKFSQ